MVVFVDNPEKYNSAKMFKKLEGEVRRSFSRSESDSNLCFLHPFILFFSDAKVHQFGGRTQENGPGNCSQSQVHAEAASDRE
jgi:hypothetical protein